MSNYTESRDQLNAALNFVASMTQRPGLSAADRLCAVTTLSFDIAVLELWQWERRPGRRPATRRSDRRTARSARR